MDKNFWTLLKSFFSGVTDLLMTFLTVGILVQVLFGGAVFGMDVVGNVTALNRIFRKLRICRVY